MPESGVEVLLSELNSDTLLYITSESCRFYEPTEIQKAVIPRAIVERCDVIGAAETVSAFKVFVVYGQQC